MKINKKNLVARVLSILVFISCMNVSYVTQVLHLNGTIMLLVRLVLIMLLMFKRYKRFLHPRKPIMMIYIWYLLIFFSTIINHQDFSYTLLILSRSFLICMFCEYYRENKGLFLVVLETWEILLGVFCLLDLYTMIIYPSGMPTTGIFSNVWFLGYKTARMAYTLPLIYISSTLSYIKKNKYDLKCLIWAILSAIACFKSSATAASIMMLFYVIVLIVISIKYKQQGKKIYQWINGKTILIGYIVVFICVLCVESIDFVQYFLTNVLQKSTSLTNRTIIWGNCFAYIKQKPILGWGYLTTEQYTEITTYTVGTSCHNLFLTMLMTIGVVGLLLYLYMFIFSLKRREKEYKMYEISLVMANVIIFVMGLTSSTLVFSMFTFLPYFLLSYDMQDEKINVKRKGIKFKGVV